MSSRNGHGLHVLARRRNGKQQACEPCRRGKVACDHSLPYCDRCRRKKVTERCVYLDAPMTKAPEERKTEPNLNFNIPTPGSSVSSSTHISEYARSSLGSGSKPSSGSAYFGPTAFSAIFSENRITLEDDNLHKQVDESFFNDSLQSQNFLMLAKVAGQDACSPQVAMGASILKSVPDQATSMFLLNWYFEKGGQCGCNLPGIRACANSIWTTFGKELKEPRQHQDMVSLASTLCKRSTTAINEEVEDYESWLDAFCGPNLRWESLGSVFAALAGAILSLPERDAFFCSQKGARSNRQNFAMEMKDCVQTCINLSNYADQLSVHMVSLLLRNFTLQTVLSGDTSEPHVS